MVKAVGLFANSVSTIGASIMNIKRKLLDIKEVFPFVFMSVIFAPIGAKIAVGMNLFYIQFAFALFLLFSATLMLKGKISQKETHQTPKRTLFLFAGIVVGLLSGILGIGGGALIVPLLVYLGYETKKVAIMVKAFIIPFSTTSAFLMYAYLIPIDWILLGVVASGALIGGLLGNYIMIFKISSEQTKKFIAIVLYVVAFKMLGDLFL
ncbi:MAG: sulfite exporter TauE/SafE family protein [Aliarcobacter sp.]|nr:sulfite exporter TauE/SafE family protein [Aliarcobacter sp.]